MIYDTKVPCECAGGVSVRVLCVTGGRLLAGVHHCVDSFVVQLVVESTMVFYNYIERCLQI